MQCGLLELRDVLSSMVWCTSLGVPSWRVCVCAVLAWVGVFVNLLVSNFR